MFKSANHLVNNLIGALLVSVLMFILVWAIDHGNPQPGGRLVLWFLAIVAIASLAGWWWLAYRAIDRPDGERKL